MHVYKLKALFKVSRNLKLDNRSIEILSDKCRLLIHLLVVSYISVNRIAASLPYMQSVNIYLSFSFCFINCLKNKVCSNEPTCRLLHPYRINSQANWHAWNINTEHASPISHNPKILITKAICLIVMLADSAEVDIFQVTELAIIIEYIIIIIIINGFI